MKYFRVFVLSLQRELQYRSNLVMWLVVGLIGPLSMVMVWFAILGDRADVGGYGRADFVMYYLCYTVGWYIIGGEFARQIGSAIHDGEINKTLLQPYNIVIGEAAKEQAWKVTSLIVTLPAIALILYLMRDYLAWSMIPGTELYLMIVVVLGAILFAQLQAIVGILAFWVVEIWPFTDILEIVLYLFGGTLAPIALLPATIQTVTEFLPFRYIFYEPVSIILGNQLDPVGVIWKQLIFIVILYGIYKMLWSAGVRRYEGIGG
jgi:ABC-2 type transport system permease protein